MRVRRASSFLYFCLEIIYTKLQLHLIDLAMIDTEYRVINPITAVGIVVRWVLAEIMRPKREPVSYIKKLTGPKQGLARIYPPSIEG